MKTFYVSIPVSCSINLTIKANSEEEAIEIADNCLLLEQTQDGCELPGEEYFEALDRGSWNVEEELSD